MFKKGFTLVELVIVIAIMGFLMSIVVVSFNNVRAQSRDQRRISDMASIQLALEQYFNKNGQYPITISQLLSSEFLSTVPTSPQPSVNAQYQYLPISSTQNPGFCISYQLWITLERTNALASTTKKGFNSQSLPANGLQKCDISNTQTVDAGNSLIYDVMPQF